MALLEGISEVNPSAARPRGILGIRAAPITSALPAAGDGKKNPSLSTRTSVLMESEARRKRI